MVNRETINLGLGAFCINERPGTDSSIRTHAAEFKPGEGDQELQPASSQRYTSNVRLSTLEFHFYHFSRAVSPYWYTSLYTRDS